LSALRNSVKTVVAPITMAVMPKAMATRPRPGRLASSRTPSTAVAASWPAMSEIWLISSARAVSSPNTRPATAMTMMRIGASEKMV
jgi:hypothetical protein